MTSDAPVSSREKYRQLCNTEPSIPIFSRDWWLDAVCDKDNWDVVLVEQNGSIVASIPFVIKKKYGLTLLNMPQLTQTLGPWMRPSKAKYAKELGQQKKIMASLICQLPDYHYFCQNFHHSITNWLQFYWAGFSQTTRYTYILEQLGNEEKLWSDLLANIKTDIKKAKNRYGLTVRLDLSCDEFLDVNEMTFRRQEMKLPYSRNLVHAIHDACAEKKACRIFFAIDEQHRIHAANFIIWDENSAYYLMGGGDPELRNSGATSLVMWEAIRFAAGVTRKFDFEGSMIEPVERFFRAFGARQVPYFQVTRINSKLLRAAKCLKGLLR